MKIYVIKKEDEIFAISESRKDIFKFYLQNNFNLNTKFSLYSISDKSDINTILILYSELYIINIGDRYIRDIDFKPIADMIYHKNEELNTTIHTLMELLNSGTVKKNGTLDSIYDTILYLKKKRKDVIDENSIISDYYKFNDYVNPFTDFISNNFDGEEIGEI